MHIASNITENVLSSHFKEHPVKVGHGAGTFPAYCFIWMVWHSVALAKVSPSVQYIKKKNKKTNLFLLLSAVVQADFDGK